MGRVPPGGKGYSLIEVSGDGRSSLPPPENNPRDALSGAVGRLQFEVLQYRLEDEYGVPTTLQTMPYTCSAWLKGDRETFEPTTTCLMARDIHDRPVVLFRSEWDKQAAGKNNPEHELLDMA